MPEPNSTTGVGAVGSYDGVWSPTALDPGTSTIEIPQPRRGLRRGIGGWLHRWLHLGHCSMRMSVGAQFITLSVDGQDYRFDRQSGDYMP